jgi:putative methyltransferase (TIGR04325 family)
MWSSKSTISNRVAAVWQSKAFRSLVNKVAESLPGLRALRRFEYERRFSRETKKARFFSGVYDSFQAALEAMPKGARVGYDHPELADRHVSEIGQIWTSDYPVLFWLKSLLAENSSLFDLGGNVGLQFYGFQKYLNYPRGLAWTVCDVPSAIELGIQIAKDRKAQGLSFTTNVEDASGVDILLVLGAFHFLEPPLWEALSKLASKPRHLLINRTPLCEGRSFATLQNMGPAICVYQIWNKDECMRRLEDAGYALVDFWEVPEFSCYIPFHTDKSVRAYSGMYFRLTR